MAYYFGLLGVPGRDSDPQLAFKRPQIPSNRDHKALNRGTLGDVGRDSDYGL